MARKLELSHDDWHELAKRCDTRAEWVKIPRVVLDTLMRDHSILIQLHRGEVTE